MSKFCFLGEGIALAAITLAFAVPPLVSDESENPSASESHVVALGGQLMPDHIHG